MTHWYQGDFVAAAPYFERTLAIFDPQRDRDLAYRFGQDIGVPPWCTLHCRSGRSVKSSVPGGSSRI